MAEGFAIGGVVRDAAGRLADLRFLDLNRALEQQTGLERQAVAGRLLSEIVPPAEVARWMGLFAGALDGGEPRSFEEQSGQLGRWYATSVYSRRGGAEVAWFYRDITGRKRAELALATSEEKFRTLADTAPALIWFNNARGENQSVNQHFLDFIGHSEASVRDLAWHTLIHPDDAPAA